MRQDRDFANRGYEDLAPVVDDYYDNASFESDEYRNHNDNIYGNLLNRPGYTPQQRAALERYDRDLAGLDQTEDERRGSFLTDEEYGSVGLSADEQAGITGDPFEARRRNFRPEFEGSILNEGQQRRRETVGQNENEYGAIDESRLRSDSGYGENVRGALSRGRNEMTGAVGRDRLTLSEGFADDYLLRPEEEQSIVTAAGQDAGAAHKTQIDRAARAGAASGITAVGQATLNDRLNKQAAISGADAMTRARIDAGGERAKRVATAEQMRLDAEGSYADRAVHVADRLAGRDVDAYGDIEQARMEGERGAASIATRRAEFNANQRLDEERDLQNAQVDMARDHAVRGYEYDRDADETRSRRAAGVAEARVGNSRWLASNRQEAERHNQGQRYQRGSNRFGIQYGREREGVAAERGDSQEARGYFTGQQRQANQNRQFGLNQRTGLYGTAAQATQGATSNALRREQNQNMRPSFWDRLTGAASGAARVAAGGA